MLCYIFWISKYFIIKIIIWNILLNESIFKKANQEYIHESQLPEIVTKAVINKNQGKSREKKSIHDSLHELENKCYDLIVR